MNEQRVSVKQCKSIFAKLGSCKLCQPLYKKTLVIVYEYNNYIEKSKYESDHCLRSQAVTFVIMAVWKSDATASIVYTAWH